MRSRWMKLSICVFTRSHFFLLVLCNTSFKLRWGEMLTSQRDDVKMDGFKVFPWTFILMRVNLLALLFFLPWCHFTKNSRNVDDFLSVTLKVFHPSNGLWTNPDHDEASLKKTVRLTPYNLCDTCDVQQWYCAGAQRGDVPLGCRVVVCGSHWPPHLLCSFGIYCPLHWNKTHGCLICCLLIIDTQKFSRWSFIKINLPAQLAQMSFLFL